MGEARRRGTFEQRKEQACIRLQMKKELIKGSQQIEKHKADKEDKNNLVLSNILNMAYDTVKIKN